MVNYREQLGPLLFKDVLPADLTNDQVLEATKHYFAEQAAALWESDWRARLSTLENERPVVAALLSAEWLIKGPEAIKVLSGGSSDFIETEAAIINACNPENQITPNELAEDIAGRFQFWVAGGMMLTAIRRATQRKVRAAQTPEACHAAFDQMRSLAQQAVEMTLAGASKEDVMALLLGQADASA